MTQPKIEPTAIDRLLKNIGVYEERCRKGLPLIFSDPFDIEKLDLAIKALDNQIKTHKFPTEVPIEDQIKELKEWNIQLNKLLMQKQILTISLPEQMINPVYFDIQHRCQRGNHDT